MKTFSFSLIFGIIIGCFICNYSISHWNFPNYQMHDTIIVKDTAQLPIKDTIYLKNITLPLSDVKVDTIRTVVNGKVTDEKINIVIK